MHVLVVGASSNSTDAALRALARAGHTVDLALSTERIRYPCQRLFSTRRVSRIHRLTPPQSHPGRCGADLIRLVRSATYDVLLPMTVEHSLVAWDHEAELAKHTALAAVPRELIQLTHDKEVLYRRARALDFAVPETFEYAGEEELLERVRRYPVVVKPRRASGAVGLRYVRSADELRVAYREADQCVSARPEFEEFARPIVQEVIPGKVYDAFSLFHCGEPRAMVTQRRDTLWPLTGGISVDVTTVDDPALSVFATKVLRGLRWHGVCDLECILDERDGCFKLIEINPRFWGILDLAVKAGVNFPHKLCEMVRTGDTPVEMDFTRGMTYTVMFPLKLYALCHARGRRREQWRAVREVLDGSRHCEVDLRDPLPHLLRLAGGMFKLIVRARPGLRPAAWAGSAESAQSCRRA